MSDSERRLEQALRAWEDHCFRQNLITRMRAVSGKPSLQGKLPPEIQRYERLRGLMLRALGLSEDENPFAEATDVGLPDREDERFAVLCDFPHALLEWARKSRRVFTLSEELQLMLEETSLDGMICSDLHLPFDTYAVGLPVPIRTPQGDSYDAILFGHEHDSVRGETVLYVMLLGSELPSFRLLTRHERRAFEEIVRRRRVKEFDAIDRLFRKRSPFPATDFFFLLRGKERRESGERPITYRELRAKARIDSDTWPVRLPSDDPCWDAYERAFHVCIGLALYLESLPVSTRLPPWEPLPPLATDVACVTDGAQVCDIQLHGSLEPHEREAVDALRERRKTVIPHFRRGTWRRSPGTGHIADAKRTVWQRPYLVHRDLLPEQALPFAHSSKVERE